MNTINMNDGVLAILAWAKKYESAGLLTDVTQIDLDDSSGVYFKTTRGPYAGRGIQVIVDRESDIRRLRIANGVTTSFTPLGARGPYGNLNYIIANVPGKVLKSTQPLGEALVSPDGELIDRADVPWEYRERLSR